ncbi:hypothetical protein Tsubulata_045809 [Turnera subulata]|uniref:DUF4283 domain-containing protein n=1 Tax=Turnera subulata TaxID=218843 RepID=A0A9Q0GIQ7_9ROSI|nr:hypothetical protein Tsubulata_045809 [Turnera subulata]
MADFPSLVLEDDTTEDGIQCHDPDSNGALALQLSKTVLLGRFVSTRAFSLNFLNLHMKKLWSCEGELKIIQKGFNTFFFKFQSESDLRWVLDMVPWSFANAHIVLKSWLPHLTCDQIDLCFGPWLKATIPTNRIYLQYRKKPEEKSESSKLQPEAKKSPARRLELTRPKTIWVPRQPKQHVTTLPSMGTGPDCGSLHDGDGTSFDPQLPHMVELGKDPEDHVCGQASYIAVGDSSALVSVSQETYEVLGDDFQTPVHMADDSGSQGLPRKRMRIDTPHPGVGLATPISECTETTQVELGQLQRAIAISLGRNTTATNWKKRARNSPFSSLNADGQAEPPLETGLNHERSATVSDANNVEGLVTNTDVIVDNRCLADVDDVSVLKAAVTDSQSRSRK